MKIDRLLHKLGLEAILTAARAVSSCMSEKGFCVNMDWDQAWDDAEPFSDERLFCVAQNASALELDFIVEASGSEGLLQVADNDTDEVIWQEIINDSMIFTQPIGPLHKGREYAVRFSGVVHGRIKITVSSRSELITELARPSEACGLPQMAQV